MLFPVQQFVSNEFSDTTSPTVHPQRYATSLVSNNRIIEIHISDFPAIDKFPEDSIQEWNLQCESHRRTPPSSFCRLRQASAYVLVFDSSRPAATFQYIRQIRDQILAYGGKDVYKKPMVVAANKQDLVVKPAHNRSHPSVARQRRTPSFLNHHQVNQHAQSNGTSKNGASSASSEWSCTVRKQWRCLYVECSAKFNWQVSPFSNISRVTRYAESSSIKGLSESYSRVLSCSGHDPARKKSFKENI